MVLLQASSEAALQDEEVIVPPHLGAGNHHGTHFVCQDSYTTTYLGQEIRVVIQDLKGITFDAAEPRTMEEIAEEVGNIYVGVFPSHLLEVPHEASRRQGEIEQEPQDTVLLVFGANLLNETNPLHCLASIAKNLAKKHLPYFIVLTKVDLLPKETTVEAAIRKVEEATGTNRAFIFPVANTIEDRQKLPPQTTLQILRLYSAILRHTQGRLGPAPWPRRASVRCAEWVEVVKKASRQLARQLPNMPHWTTAVMMLLVVVVGVLFAMVLQK